MPSVLVVEDNPDLRFLYCQAVELAGFHALTAENGREALQLAAKDPSLFGLIILDLMMPVLDGWEFLEERRQIPALAAIPVVICSAASDKVPSGIEVLEKPVDLGRLIEVIERFCGR